MYSCRQNVCRKIHNCFLLHTTTNNRRVIICLAYNHVLHTIISCTMVSVPCNCYRALRSGLTSHCNKRFHYETSQEVPINPTRHCYLRYKTLQMSKCMSPVPISERVTDEFTHVVLCPRCL